MTRRIRKFDLNQHEMRIMVFALGVLLRQYDDVKEIIQMGFTRDQIIEISKKLRCIGPFTRESF